MSKRNSGLTYAHIIGAWGSPKWLHRFPFFVFGNVVKRSFQYMMPFFDRYTTDETVGFEPQYEILFDLKQNVLKCVRAIRDIS